MEQQVSIVDDLGSPTLSTIARVRSALEAVDGFVADVMEDVAAKLTEAGLPGTALRERAHLDPLVKDECGRRNGRRPAPRTLRSSDFPGLGPVDVVLERPRALLELKWAYGVPAKIFESVWDATKLALLGAHHGYAALYVVCGASDAEWAVSESAELFAPGEIDVLALWRRPLIPPRGPNYGLSVGADLEIGARGNRPRRAHARVAVRSVARCRVAGDHELRAVGVVGLGPLVQWPDELASGVGANSPEPLAEVELPARVTQAWIERTVPRLAPAAIGPFLRALTERGWNDAEVDARVRPHLPNRR